MSIAIVSCEKVSLLLGDRLKESSSLHATVAKTTRNAHNVLYSFIFCINIITCFLANYCVSLSHGYMETALLYLIFNIASALFSQVVQHLAQYEFQCVVAHLAALLTVWRTYGLVAVVADVEGRAIEMTRIFSSISIVVSQFLHVALASRNARNYRLVKWYALYLQAVEIVSAYVVQQLCGSRHRGGDSDTQEDFPRHRL